VVGGGGTGVAATRAAVEAVSVAVEAAKASADACTEASGTPPPPIPAATAALMAVVLAATAAVLSATFLFKLSRAALMIVISFVFSRMARIIKINANVVAEDRNTVGGINHG